ncbi:MAG: amidohydrolase [Anaerolineae bacterium]
MPARIDRRPAPELVALRRDLHAHPELGYAEHRTSATVRAWLDGIDVPYRAGLAGSTGVVATLPATVPAASDGAASRPAVALRADMDALPIVEATGAQHASRTPGVMHACGHDGHTAILLGAAKILAALPAQPQPVTFLFQPAEEGGAGGRRMVEDGALAPVEGAPVRVVYGLHGWPDVPVGHIATRTGPLMAACSRFDIAVTGQGGHAAQPDRTRDPVLAAAHIVTAFQSVVSRNVAPDDAAVVTVAAIHGGSAFNLVPDRVELSGTIRAFDDAVFAHLTARIDAVATGVAAAMGCAASVRWGDVYPTTVNDAGATARLVAIARAALGSDRVDDAFPPTTTAEDFAYYGHEAPACFFFLGVRDPSAAAWPQLHQADYDFNDDAIAWGVELMVRLALEG